MNVREAIGCSPLGIAFYWLEPERDIWIAQAQRSRLPLDDSHKAQLREIPPDKGFYYWDRRRRFKATMRVILWNDIPHHVDHDKWEPWIDPQTPPLIAIAHRTD